MAAPAAAKHACYGSIDYATNHIAAPSSSISDGMRVDSDPGDDAAAAAAGRSRRQSAASGKESIAMAALTDHESVISEESHESAQAGVKRAEAIASTWSSTGLLVAYLGIILVAIAVSQEVQMTSQLTIFATSSFNAHSLVSTVGVVQSIVLSVAKPPMSKAADVFGRFETFSFAILIYVIGYIQQAASSSVATYVVAQIFYAAGQTGLQILTQIFVADTSDLLTRAFVSSIPDIPYLFTFWTGPPLAQAVLPNWRLGYGIWALILPVAFLPLALALSINQKKAARRGLLPPSPLKADSMAQTAKNLWYELDIMGLLLISGAVAFILVPLTLASRAGWRDPTILTTLAIGIACLVLIPLWERNERLAPRPFFPAGLMKNRTLLAGFGISFFYFMAFYMSVYPYFQSYLLVVMGQSVTAAGYIVQVFTFAATVSSLTVSVMIRYTKKYRPFVVAGSLVYLFGIILMILYRTEGTSVTALVVTQLIIGLGGSMIHTPAQIGVQASATHQEVAAVTAIFLTFLEVGGAAGNALSGAVWSTYIPRKLALYLPPETQDQAGKIYSNVSIAANGWPMGSPTRVAINRAYQETMRMLLALAMCIAIPVVILSFVMQNYRLDEIDQGVKGTVIGAQQDPAERRESTTALLAGPSNARRSSLGSEEGRDDSSGFRRMNTLASGIESSKRDD